MKLLEDNWQAIKQEAVAMHEMNQIKNSSNYDDAGFNSFFKTGWKRFYLKWYNVNHPSAMTLCPVTTQLLNQIPSVKAAMFAELPAGSRLVRHRDPYAGSVRYHLGLVTPNSPDCHIVVDGELYSWKDGESVVFDETYIHYAENKTNQNRIILFCDLERPMKYRWAAKLNHWIGKYLMSAASAPNQEGDKTGGINKAFKYAYMVRRLGKEIKSKNRTVYYILKWALIGGLIAAFLFI
jgi:beta-hydroxylase